MYPSAWLACTELDTEERAATTIAAAALNENDHCTELPCGFIEFSYIFYLIFSLLSYDTTLPSLPLYKSPPVLFAL